MEPTGGKELGSSAAHGEDTTGHAVVDSSIFNVEAKWAKLIPGGYSPSRVIKLKGRKMVMAILVAAALAILFFGYDAGIMALVIVNEDYLKTMGTDSGSNQAAAANGGLVSLWFGGFMIGAIMVGFYADKIGRLRTITLGCVWAVVGAALQASAQNFSWMAFARIIGGIGCGHLNTIVPIWTSELADPHMRGAFVAVEFTLAVGGICAVYWIEYACYLTQPAEFAWRFPLALQIVLLLILLVLVPFYVESPRYLAKIGRIDDARAVLDKSRVDPRPEAVDQEMHEIMEAIQLEATGTSSSFWKMLTQKDDLHTRRRILLGAGVQVMQKFTGIDFITTYAPQMFALSGFQGQKPNLLAGGNLIPYTFSLALSIWLIDRVGRRNLMLIGCTLMGIELLVGGILAHFVKKYAESDADKAKQFGAGVASILYIYTSTYGATWLTVCWVYPSEIFPLASRAKGVAIATVAFSVAGGFVNEITPYLISAVDYWVFIIFALVNFGMLVPLFLFYIETANRHLEELDLLFAGKSNISWKAEKEYLAAKEEQQEKRVAGHEVHHAEDIAAVGSANV